MATNEDLLFVELAVKRELLTPEQVDEILALQTKLREMGLTEAVADLALKRGMLSEKDAKALLVRVSPKGGRQQIEGYRLVERLGRGGMGSVYKAVQLSMGRPVAIKVLKPSLVKSDQQTERLRREAQLVGKLRHPNIVQGLDFGVSNGFHYFTMEYVEGESVRDLVEKHGPMKEKTALRIVTEVAKALEYAHREGVVHRDVKPGNILVGRDGSVLLADYGLAKGPLEDVELTHSGVTVGTPQYISPEQARGPSDVDIRTDLYSLGATFYHMVTGRPPYEGETLAHLIQQVLYEPYAPPRTLRKDLSDDVAFVIEKLMARKPRHRYQTPKELLKDLEAIGKGRSVVPGGWHGDFETFHARRKIRRIAVAACLLVLLAAGGASFYSWRQAVKENEAREAAARSELQAMLSVAVRADGLAERIRRFEGIAEKYEGTRAAREIVTRYLPADRAKLRHLEDWNRARQQVLRLQKKGEYGKALGELRGFLQEKKDEPAAGEARTEADRQFEELVKDRDAAVVERSRQAIEALAGAKPAAAAADLRELDRELGERMYEADEPRAELNRSLTVVVERLESAVAGIAERLGPIREALSAKDPDYRELDRRIGLAREDLRSRPDLLRAIEGLPEAWRQSLMGEFDGLEERVRSENAQALDSLTADLRQTVREQGRYEAAVDRMRALAARSVEELAARARETANEMRRQLDALEREARLAFDRNLDEYLRALGMRNWGAARLALDELRPILDRYVPSRWPLVLEGMVSVLGFAEGTEKQFVAKVRALEQLPDGLRFDGIEYRQIRNVTFAGDQISFVTSEGRRISLPLARVDLRNLFEYAEVTDPESPRHSFYFAVLRFAELRASDSARRIVDEIDGFLLERIARIARTGDAGPYPELAPFAQELLPVVRETREQAYGRLQLQQKQGRDLYEEILRNRADGNWQKVLDDAKSLLEGALKDTDAARDNRARLKELIEEAQEKLPSEAMRQHYGIDTVHLAGQKVEQRDFRERLIFGMENEAQLAAFRYTDGRVAVVETTRPVLGPPPPDRPLDEHRSRAEHLLVFRPPVKDASEWPKFHPLRLDSPFVYSEPMAIEFRIRWERPMALLVSLCGTNLLVLSAPGGMEYGRGVIIWQSKDIENPDETAPGVERHRAKWLAEHPEALEGDARHREYFQFLPERWYGVRFETDTRTARLLVDGVEVLKADVKQYAVKSEEIVLRTWMPAEVDEIRVEGTVDPQWYQRVILRGR